MSRKITGLCECPIARIAFVWPFAGMCSWKCPYPFSLFQIIIHIVVAFQWLTQMYIQMCFPAEPATALATQEWFFTAMRTRMYMQIVFGIKSFLALRTSECSFLGMRLTMLLQNVRRGEWTIAHVATMQFFASMQTHMIGQWFFFQKRFATFGTFEWHRCRMQCFVYGQIGLTRITFITFITMKWPYDILIVSHRVLDNQMIT